MEERRKHLRLPLSFKANLKLPDGTVLKGQTRNVCFGGTFVEFDAIPQVKKHEYFSLVILPRIEFTCRVIHTKPDGIGFEFNFILIRYYEKFKDLLLANSPDRDRMIKELGRWAEE